MSCTLFIGTIDENSNDLLQYEETLGLYQTKLSALLKQRCFLDASVQVAANKADPLTGEIRMNDYGRPRLKGDKSKVDFNE